MGGRSDAWTIRLSWQQEQVVKAVNHPLRLNVLFSRIEFSRHRSVDHMMGDLNCLLIVLCYKTTSKGKDQILQDVDRGLSVQLEYTL